MLNIIHLVAFIQLKHVIYTNKSKGLKIVTPKQMLQRLPIALAQVKKDNNSENLLNEIRQIVTLCINQKKLLKNYTIT